MMKLFLLFLVLTSGPLVYSQNIEINKKQENIKYTGSSEITFQVKLKKNSSYLITVFQNKIDIKVDLIDPENKIEQTTDLADGNSGYDKIDFIAKQSGDYKISIKGISNKVVPNGEINVCITTYGKAQLQKRKEIQKTLQTENSKSIYTLDIKQFWEMYDNLKFCKTTNDSIRTIQTLYLDRGTNGLRQFAKVRDFSAEMFVKRIWKYKNYYNSIRQNSFIVYELNSSIDSIANNLKKIYPNVSDFKVAFVIGPMLAAGTISSNVLLIAAEMQTGDKTSDVNEITNPNLKTDIVSTNNLIEVKAKLEETITHELVHTQQKERNKNACSCPLLENIIKEGVASFIAEKNLGRPNKITQYAIYGQKNEKALWYEMKSELCTNNYKNWLFNASSSKDRPGDLGYYVGYKIAESYYNQASDKQQAYIEMIEMDNPLLFLDKSKYDLKFLTTTN
ncbi:DUF2268 domain-containing protein [Flavobacterium sp. LS1R49]|uniref:DUF2268 domain-containing protein n=1 Tax=Flavobacterium shii TaxID=2987687 RepID=A0A9X2YT86_9FLAO|nr:DUF2268 domain-containing protein [Flavobacterium shii]MCV9926343.1 DUF2268 domain-containing protein [Flavobacterium shii]